MKKLLLILLCLPMIGFGQLTYVPDDVFEQALIYYGYDNVLDDSVLTANIASVTSLNVVSSSIPVTQTGDSISDLTGIEDFIALTDLQCARNKLTSLDVSQNINLMLLNCDKNKLTTLNINNCVNLHSLKIEDNQLTTLDLTTNINLTEIEMSGNLVTCLDVSHLSSNGFELLCNDNLLEELNVKNGVGTNIDLDARNNNLNCIEVSNIGYATNNFVVDNFTSFSTNCNYTNPCWSTSAIQEHTTNKKLLKVTDLLGRETKQTNQPLFYIYDDGTVEKRIVIE